MPLKPFARPRQSLPASSDSPARLGTPTPLHGKSSLSRSTTFDEEPEETPLKKRLPRATVHSYATAGTQTPPQSPNVQVTTPITRTRSRMSIATPGSPYYSPDSPSQISRSTIIPFDAEASRRAAAERKESRESGDDGVVVVVEGPQTPVAKIKGRLARMISSPAPVTPVKRRGVVRKRSLWDRYVFFLPLNFADMSQSIAPPRRLGRSVVTRYAVSPDTHCSTNSARLPCVTLFGSCAVIPGTEKEARERRSGRLVQDARGDQSWEPRAVREGRTGAAWRHRNLWELDFLPRRPRDRRSKCVVHVYVYTKIRS